MYALKIPRYQGVNRRPTPDENATSATKQPAGRKKTKKNDGMNRDDDNRQQTTQAAAVQE